MHRISPTPIHHIARLLALTAILLFAPNLAQAQTLIAPESLPQGFVILLDDTSGTASDDRPIYFVTNHNGWNPSDPEGLMTRTATGRWRIEWPQPIGTDKVEFKFTLGDWNSVECDSGGADISDRSLPLIDPSSFTPGEKPIIEFLVVRFKAGTPPKDVILSIDPDRTLNVTGDVRKLVLMGGAGPASNFERQALVWLPPGYDEPANEDRRYPVLIMNDGQTAFEELPWITGEWRADETAQQLIESGRIEPIIIVAVPHSGDARLAEYQPFPMFRTTKPAGDKFVDWLADDALAQVRTRYRTRPGPEHTAIAGAGLGGAIALHAARSRSDVFGLVLAESLPLLSNHKSWDKYLRNKQPWPRKLVIGMGDSESGTHPKDADRNARYLAASLSLSKRANASGMNTDDVLVILGRHQGHSESAWADRLPQSLEFLFPNR